MEAVLSENKNKILKGFSLFFSVVALILSLISIVGLNKLQNKILNSDIDTKIMNEKNENLKIDAIPEVEVLHSDGSTEKIRAKQSEDKISMIIEEKVERPKNRSRKEHQKKNINNKFQKLKVVERKKHKEEMKNIEKQNNQNSVNKDSEKAKNSFYIQLGLFKNEGSARKNCDKTAKKLSLAGKVCNIKKDNKNRFASVIQGFKTKDEAIKFAKKLAEKENISFLIKKSL